MFSIDVYVFSFCVLLGLITHDLYYAKPAVKHVVIDETPRVYGPCQGDAYWDYKDLHFKRVGNYGDNETLCMLYLRKMKRDKDIQDLFESVKALQREVDTWRIERNTDFKGTKQSNCIDNEWIKNQVRASLPKGWMDCSLVMNPDLADQCRSHASKEGPAHS